jgi:cytochrome c-type biogenesis protein CcmH/NrfG
MSRQPVSVGGRGDAAEVKTALLGRLGLRADASDQDIEATHSGVVEFLELAPREVNSWAAIQTAEVDQAFALLSGPEQDLLSGAAGVVLSKEDLSETPVAAAAAPPVHTPPVVPATPWAPASLAANKPLRNKIVGGGAILLIIAVVFAVFQSGKSSDVPGISGTTTGQQTAAPAQPTAVPVDKAKVAALTTKVTANPKDKVSLQALGDLYFASADYKNASVWEQKVLSVDPKNQVALLALGAAQFNLGKAPEAKKTWLIAAGLYPKSAEVHYDLGFLYMSQTPPDKANMQAEWKKVVDIDPNSNLAKTVATHIKSSTATPTAAPSAK